MPITCKIDLYQLEWMFVLFLENRPFGPLATARHRVDWPKTAPRHPRSAYSSVTFGENIPRPRPPTARTLSSLEEPLYSARSLVAVPRMYPDTPHIPSARRR